MAAADEEMELGAADLDTIFHDGLGDRPGRAIADTLALALDPYPRSADADAALKEAGVIRRGRSRARSRRLAALKAQLDGRSSP